MLLATHISYAPLAMLISFVDNLELVSDCLTQALLGLVAMRLFCAGVSLQLDKDKLCG